MSDREWWENIWSTPTQDRIFLKLKPDQVEGHAVPQDGLVVANEKYLHIMLRTLRIVNVRDRVVERFYGTVQSFASLPHRSGSKASFHVVAAPQELIDLDPNNADKVILGDRRLLGPVPYCGGDLETRIGLFAVRSQNLVAPFLNLLETLSKSAGVSLIGAAAPYIVPLREGIRLLFGPAGASKTLIAIAKDFDSPETGHYLLLGASENQVDPKQIRVSEDWKVHANGKLLDKYPYLIFSIYTTDQKDDWYTIPELRECYDKLVADAYEGKLKEANDWMTIFRRLAMTCKDLIPSDAKNLVKKVEMEKEEATGGVTLTSGAAGASRLRMREFSELALYDGDSKKFAEQNRFQGRHHYTQGIDLMDHMPASSVGPSMEAIPIPRTAGNSVRPNIEASPEPQEIQAWEVPQERGKAQEAEVQERDRECRFGESVDEEIDYIFGSLVPVEEVTKSDRHISAWINDAPSALTPGKTYDLNFKVGDAVLKNLLEADDTVVSSQEIPKGGLETDWVIISSSVKLDSSDELTIIEKQSTPVGWTARFSLVIPEAGESDKRRVRITPGRASSQQIHVLIYAVSGRQDAGPRRELYRQFTVSLDVLDAQTQSVKVKRPATIIDDMTHVRSDQVNLRTLHEWTTPPGELSLTVVGTNWVNVEGDTRNGYIKKTLEWKAKAETLTNPMENVMKSAERFRAKWEDYLNDIDPQDLAGRLKAFNPTYDWGTARFSADDLHTKKWEEVSVSKELSELAFYGKELFDALFQPGEAVRKVVEELDPGWRINFAWRSSGNSNWIPHIPLGLMYHLDWPASGDPVDPTGFWSLRFRLEYCAHDVGDSSKALGAPGNTHAGNLLYWGSDASDVTAVESAWQRETWQNWENQIFIPNDVRATNPKQFAVRQLNAPTPKPMTVLYLFCQCKVGDGSDPVLSFANSTQLSDVITRTELGVAPLLDKPLIFANACTTSTADPYQPNELEIKFFKRGCRAYVGTETKVPIQLASRFAYIFFQFLYRKVDPLPISAGEAISQTRLLLWTNYKNIGGLFYSYVSLYELFMVAENEIPHLRG